jgi:hypothetical protein
MAFCLIVGMLWARGVPLPAILPGFQLVPEWWGLTLTSPTSRRRWSATCRAPLRARHAAQPVLDHLVSHAFWLISTLTTVAALPRVAVAPAPRDLGKPDRDCVRVAMRLSRPHDTGRR